MHQPYAVPGPPGGHGVPPAWQQGRGSTLVTESEPQLDALKHGADGREAPRSMATSQVDLPHGLRAVLITGFRRQRCACTYCGRPEVEGLGEEAARARTRRGAERARRRCHDGSGGVA